MNNTYCFYKQKDNDDGTTKLNEQVTRFSHLFLPQEFKNSVLLTLYPIIHYFKWRDLCLKGGHYMVTHKGFRMKIKKKFLGITFLCLLLSFHSTSFGFFDDLFKDIDFDQLAKEIEKTLEENPIPGLQKPQPRETKQAPQKQETKLIAGKDFKDDPKSLFLDPLATQPPQGGAKKGSFTFPKEKEDNFNFIMTHLVKLLKALEKKVDFAYPEKQEEFFGYKKKIDDIVVAYQMIRDKNMYVRVFFLPQFNDLRKRIFTIRDQLERLNNDLEIKPELEETVRTEDEVKGLLDEPDIVVDKFKPILKKKKSRGRK